MVSVDVLRLSLSVCHATVSLLRCLCVAKAHCAHVSGERVKSDVERIATGSEPLPGSSIGLVELPGLTSIGTVFTAIIVTSSPVQSHV